MKAKDAAKKLNAVAKEHGLQEAWDSMSARMVAGATDEELLPDAEALQEKLAAVIQPAGSEYLNFLVSSLAERVAGQQMKRTESVRAAILEADRAWRGFHSRLDPIVARVINEEALKNTVISLLPHTAQLTWPEFAPPKSPRLH